MSRGQMRVIMSDMDDHSKMKSDARAWIKSAMEMGEKSSEQQQAAHIKRQFDAKYGPTWHVIVGSDFKANTSHEAKSFIFVNVGKTNVLIFRAG